MFLRCLYAQNKEKTLLLVCFANSQPDSRAQLRTYISYIQYMLAVHFNISSNAYNWHAQCFAQITCLSRALISSRNFDNGVWGRGVGQEDAQKKLSATSIDFQLAHLYCAALAQRYVVNATSSRWGGGVKDIWVGRELGFVVAGHPLCVMVGETLMLYVCKVLF